MTFNVHISKLRVAVLAGLLTVAGVTSLIAWQPSGARATVASVEAKALGDTPRAESYADVVDLVAPAVVSVYSERTAPDRGNVPQRFDLDDPLWRRFFGERPSPFGRMPSLPQPRWQQGLGSGVIVSEDGYILTNHHVIAGADSVTVELHDRRRFAATVIGSDEPSDVAVLKIDETGLPALALGDSDAVRVGDVALAVGNPLGIGETVTMGIVSAKGRTSGVADGSYENFLQTDAPINQGNSGGALVNLDGALVGINSQIVSPTGGNIGIGFAVPSNMARHVMDQLVAHGTVRRGRLGVSIQTITAEMAKSLDLADVRGAIVGSVELDSPAHRAGVQRGDVVNAFSGTPIIDSNHLRNLVGRMAPGTVATLGIIRDRQPKELQVELGTLSADEVTERLPRPDGPDSLGLTVSPVTPDLAERYNVSPETAGLAVVGIDPRGAAATSGIRQGDVIEEVDGQPVRSRDDLYTSLRQAEDRPALVLLNRSGYGLYVTVTTESVG